MSTRARKLWHVANLAIFASRAFRSVIVHKIDDNHHSLTLSEISVVHSSAATFEVDRPTPPPVSNVSSPHNIFFPTVDHQRLVQSIVKNKDLEALRALGGVKGVASSLGTDPETGIPDNEDIKKRREMFSPNTFSKEHRKGFLYFVLDGLKDIKLLVLLALSSFAVGFGIKEQGGRKGWYDGVGIFIAVLINVLISALNNFKQEIQFHNLSEENQNTEIEVIRGGGRRQISIFNIVVGDVVLLKIGDQVPADGLFLSGHSLQVNTLSITGESDLIQIDSTERPFLFFGSEVIDGYARMLVTSVGINEKKGSPSYLWKERTPLQNRLAKLASSIEKVGLTIASLFLLVMVVYYIFGITKHGNGNMEHNGNKTDIHDVLIGVVRIVAVAVVTAVVADPEGLRSAVILTLAYSLRKMMADRVLMRKLSACEGMGSATTICTAKTGILTCNHMRVVQFWCGQECFNTFNENNIALTVCELFRQGVGLNTTGSMYKPVSGSEPEFAGSPTEKAILSCAYEFFRIDMEQLKYDYEVLHVETFNSEKKRSGVLLRKNVDGTMYVHWKGAAEMVLEMCSSYYESYGRIKFLDEDARNKFGEIIEGMAASSLRCIAFAHCQILELEQVEYIDENKTQLRLKEDCLTLLGIVGIKDPCRPGVREAVRICKLAGVSIKMITGENIFTAKAIATECGILESAKEQFEGAVVEGMDFRNYTPEQRMKRIESISVMARSSPFDKLLMIQCLKQNGQLVAATGDGINDTPALREADIGLSMGVQGTEVAKLSSDLVILDDNFISVVKAVRWGRTLYNNVQKVVQFQLTLNFSALTINFIAAVSVGKIPFTAVQLLWVNLIMDVLGALALATEPPTDELMHRPPLRVWTEPLITSNMWRNILAQSTFQIATLLFLHFKGRSIFHVSRDVNSTMVFNTFVLCQVFNMFNSRKMESKNVFKGISRNLLFMGIVGMTTVLQVVIVEFLNKLADTRSLNWWQWLACILLAALTLPIGCIVKSIPVSHRDIAKLKTAVVTSIIGGLISAIISALFNLHKESD